jgi:hypothetical protein
MNEPRGARGPLYIDGGGRWHLHQVALPQGRATLDAGP